MPDRKTVQCKRQAKTEHFHAVFVRKQYSVDGALEKIRYAMIIKPGSTDEATGECFGYSVKSGGVMPPTFTSVSSRRLTLQLVIYAENAHLRHASGIINMITSLGLLEKLLCFPWIPKGKLFMRKIAVIVGNHQCSVSSKTGIMIRKKTLRNIDDKNANV